MARQRNTRFLPATFTMVALTSVAIAIITTA